MKEIYYKKTLPTRRVRLATFKGVSTEWYSKDVPIDYAICQENLRAVNGALVPSMSPQSCGLKFDRKILKMVPYFDGTNKLLVVLDNVLSIVENGNNGVTITNIAKNFELYDATQYKYEDESYLILATDAGLKKLQNNQVTDSVINFPFTIICNHFYRIFGAINNSMRLLFSDDFNPFNWMAGIDEGGYINMAYEQGNITDLISFHQYMLVCQESGFTRIYAYSDQTEFEVKALPSPYNIKRGSVVNCGDMVMYATDSGLGFFDGYTFKTAYESLSSFLKGANVQAAVAGEVCYFLCTKEDEQKSNLIAYDIVNKEYHFINHDGAKSLAKVKTADGEKLLIAYDKEIKVLKHGNNFEPKIWMSGVFDFKRPATYKLLRRLVFGGRTSINVKIVVDGKNHFYSVDKNRDLALNLKGKEFEITLQPLGADVNMSAPILEYSVLEGY